MSKKRVLLKSGLRHDAEKVITSACRARRDLSENTISSRYIAWLKRREFSQFWWFRIRVKLNFQG